MRNTVLQILIEKIFSYQKAFGDTYLDIKNSVLTELFRNDLRVFFSHFNTLDRRKVVLIPLGRPFSFYTQQRY